MTSVKFMDENRCSDTEPRSSAAPSVATLLEEARQSLVLIHLRSDPTLPRDSFDVIADFRAINERARDTIIAISPQPERSPVETPEKNTDEIKD